MGKALSIFVAIFATFALYLVVLFTLQLASLPLTGKTVSEGANQSVKFKIGTTSDLLELRENLGDVYSAISETNMPELLSGGSIQTDEGATAYNQYIRFEDESQTLDGAIVNFTEENGRVSDFLFIDNGVNATDAIFEYELEFEQGLESDIISNKLEDLEDENLNILGRKFRITKTRIDTVNDEIELQMVDAAAVSTLKEGEKKTIKIGNREYNVEVMVITDVTNPEVKLKINDEVLNSLKESESTTLSDGKLVVVDNIISSEAGEGSGDFVDVFIDAYKIVFKDNDYTGGFEQGLKVGQQAITDGFVSIAGNEIGSDRFEVTSVNYRLISNGELYFSSGHGLREFLSQKNGMVTEFWDLVYEGLSSPGKSTLKFDPVGDERYKIEFTNKKGEKYLFSFLNNRGNAFNLGDENGNNLTFIEASNTSDYIVGDDDFFVLTNKNDKNGYTAIIQYNSIDTSAQTLTFNDLAGGTKQATYTLSNVSGRLGEADLSSGGTTYRVYIANSPAASYPLAIDYTADGALNSSEANVIIKGGGILDLGSSNNPTGNFTVSLTTASSQLDEASGDEVVSWTMERRTGNEVGISSTFTGISLEQEDDHYYGMTRYGSFVDFFDDEEGRAETFAVEYPEEQIGANVYVTVSIPVKLSAKEEVKEETKVEEKIVENKSQEIQQKAIQKPAEKPVQTQVQQTLPVARVRTTQKRGSLVIPAILIMLMIIVVVIIGVIAYNRSKPKEPSAFQSYIVR